MPTLKRFRFGFATVIAVVSLSFATVVPAQAIVNGQLGTGFDYGVAIVSKNLPTRSGCSGTYFRPRVVITAAHCVIREDGRTGDLRSPLDELFVSQTGADLNTVASQKSLVQVLRVWTPEDYFQRYDAENFLFETQIDDIAFLFLESELEGPHVDRGATPEEVEQFRAGLIQGHQLGYGCLGQRNGVISPNLGMPFWVEGITGTFKTADHIPDQTRLMIVNYRPNQGVCPGDSGSGLLAKIGAETVYVATVFAGGPLDEVLHEMPGVGSDSMTTVLWPFMKYLEAEEASFRVELSKLLAAAEAKRLLEVRRLAAQRQAKVRAFRAGTLYVSTGCHAVGIRAELQVLRAGKWQRIANAKVWETNKRCPESNPVSPWTTARLPANSKLRWRYFSPGQWSETSEVFNSKRPRR